MTTPVPAKLWALIPIPTLAAALTLCLMVPQPSQAIPAFARKYGVKCYTCHLIPPVLNKTGYVFKRLGYRMPPDDMDLTKPAPKISELDKNIRWSLVNSVALMTGGSFTVDKTKAEESSSASSFNLEETVLFAGGSLPETNFSYFVEHAFFEDGENMLHQAWFGYTAGRANNSFFARAGKAHLQEGEGTRAVMMFNLFPEASPLLSNASPVNFSLDQGPVGVNVGYTWASPYFGQVFGLSMKVTNGVNDEGEAIVFDSEKNSKDVWFDADYWFGPDGGISFIAYNGRKDQIQNEGTPDEFTFRPTVRRYGILGNYLFFDKLDLLGGYVRSSDDWKETAGQATTRFISDGYRGEADFYPQRGFAIMGRYDRLNQNIQNLASTHVNAWGVGVQKALTEMGNIVARATYTQERDMDPITSEASTDKLLKADIRFMW